MVRAHSILLVEDDKDHSAVLSELLEEEGYLVKVFPNGAEAMAALRRSPGPAVVVADLQMPGMNGRELIAALRGDSELSRVPVIILTGSQINSIPPIDGASGVLQKPIPLELLLATLDKVTNAAAGPNRSPSGEP